MTEPRKNIVGVFEKRKSGRFVVPLDKRVSREIRIPGKNNNGALNGQVVTVTISKPNIHDAIPQGTVTDIIGFKNEPGVDVLSLARMYGVDIKFTKKIKDASKAVPTAVSPAECEGRRDLRERLIITIDSEDAKDLDDAVSLETLENGNALLGVHIADVSHYVEDGSSLDKQARHRANSVYLIDRVFPMLPPRLSNWICSLRPGQERLTLSCELEIDPSGETVGHEIFTAVINSRKRLTFDTVSELLKGGEPQLEREHADVLPMLREMERVAGLLREKRHRRGAIEFEFTETKIVLNENGEPTDILPVERNIAMDMIEDFMVVCNETVAEAYADKGLPFIYRSHEPPDPEKLGKLRRFARDMGYELRGDGSSAIQRLLSDASGKPEAKLLGKLALRSLKQAAYTPQNRGHYGLAARYYCHFTAPIRRYSDLFIHHVIKADMRSELDAGRAAKFYRKLANNCTQCSIKEREADELSRAVDDLKKVQYMAGKLGEVYDGTVSGVGRWGLVVQLPNTAEGFVYIERIEDDYYEFDEKNMLLIGQRTGRIFRFGDSLAVRVKRASVEERRLEFEPVYKHVFKSNRKNVSKK